MPAKIRSETKELTFLNIFSSASLIILPSAAAMSTLLFSSSLKDNDKKDSFEVNYYILSGDVLALIVVSKEIFIDNY